jgi:hypothetical protein
VEYGSLIFLHVAIGIFWAGAGIVLGFFILPAVLEAGPAGGAVMGGVAKRGLPLVMTLAGLLVVLTGARLFMLRYTAGFLGSPEGIVLTLGAILGIAGLAIGFFVQKPTVQRISTLAGQIAASGGPPTPAQAAELQALRQRLRRTGAVLAWHLIAASALMASHRLATML